MPGESVAYKEYTLPPYYDRFIDEREKRFVAEIQRLEDLIKSGNQQINQRIDALEVRMDGFEKRMDGFEKRMDGISGKIDHLFYWLIGLFVPLILSVTGAVLTMIFK
ncbi:MAG: hypothetical protein AB1414_01585 [bacterium]